MALIPGATYDIRLIITNTTTRGGVPYPTSLYVRLSASGLAATNPDPELIGEEFSFGAGETRTLSYPWHIPTNISPSDTLWIWVKVYSPYPQIKLAEKTVYFETTAGGDYLTRIAAATTKSQLSTIRAEFEGELYAGSITYDQYITYYNAYIARYFQVP